MPYVRPPRMQQPQSMPEAKVPLTGKSIAETAAQTALLVKKSRDLLDGVRSRVKEEAISRRAVSDQLRTANVEGSPPLRAPCIESPPGRPAARRHAPEHEQPSPGRRASGNCNGRIMRCRLALRPGLATAIRAIRYLSSAPAPQVHLLACSASLRRPLEHSIRTRRRHLLHLLGQDPVRHPDRRLRILLVPVLQPGGHERPPVPTATGRGWSS